MTDYILEIRYPSDEATDEQVQARLFLAGSAGSWLLEDQGHTTVEAYFSDAATRDHASSDFHGLAAKLTATDRLRLDWLTLYQQSLAPIEIGERFVIAPDWSLIPPSDRLPIVIPQELAFGTGSHETTALCLEELERIDLHGRLCADIGTGSGILAMAMLLAGARKVVAFDNDLDAFAPIRDNIRRNQVRPDRMPVFIGTVEALRGTFALITMNIVPEVILPLLPLLMTRLRPEADLILSGILTTRRAEVVAACAAKGLSLASERNKGEWWCGRLTHVAG
jgi:ribosomal protein L11 methyltransferase